MPKLTTKQRITKYLLETSEVFSNRVFDIQSEDNIPWDKLRNDVLSARDRLDMIREIYDYAKAEAGAEQTGFQDTK